MNNTRQRNKKMKILSIFLAIFVAAAIMLRLASPLESYDIWWHMLLGKIILSTGNLVPDHSLLTWTPANAYAVYNSWLAEVLLYWIYKYSGATGLVLLRYLVYLIAFLLSVQFAFRKGVLSAPLSWLIILVGFNFLAGGNTIKPELFTVLFTTLCVWLFFSYRSFQNHTVALPYLLPLLLLVWLNMHGAFFIISLFFAATIIGDFLNRKFSPSFALTPNKRKHYYIALLLCIPVLFANPFGYELPLHIIKSVIGLAPKYDIRTYGFRPTSEFNAPPYYLLDYMVLAMSVFLGLVLIRLKQKKIDWVAVLLFIGFSALFVQFVRLTYFLGPIFIFVALDMLGDIKKTKAWEEYKKTRGIIAILSVSLIIASGWNITTARQCYLQSDAWSLSRYPNQPVIDAEYIKNNLTGTKVGNLYNDGGYLAYQLWPDKKITIDTRNFPFLDWTNEYFDFSEGNNVDEFLDKYNADYWYIRYSYNKLYAWFINAPNWEMKYFGTKGAIFVPSGTNQKQKISINIDPSTDANNLLLLMSSALMLDDFTIAKQVNQVALASLGRGCNPELSDKIKVEMGIILKAYQAFKDGRLEDSYTLLTNQTEYIHDKKQIKKVIERIMMDSWKSGNTNLARQWAKKLLDYSNDAVDVYNFMLIDWQWRQSNREDHSPKDSLHWKKLADLLYQHRDALAAKQPKILAVVQTLRKGQYAGDAELIANHYLPTAKEDK